MRNTRRLLGIALLLAATACAQFRPAELAEGSIVSKEPFEPGYADIGAVGVVAATSGNYRLHLTMANGRSQTVEVDNPIFMTDQRVELTPQGRVALISGTTFKR